MQASSFLVKSRGISEKGKFLVKVVRDKVLRLFRPRARPLIPRRFRRARDSFGGQGLNYEYSCTQLLIIQFSSCVGLEKCLINE